MGVTYRRLPPSSQRGDGVRPRAWVVLLRRAAASVAVRLYAARRRCGGARRLAWAGLCGRGAAVAVAATAPRRISAPAAPAGYDSASYARNFDDGVWKAEEGVFWRTGSFACRFAHHASAATPPASGSSVSSSTS